MILLTRLSGSAFVLNADLIERLDSTPDTVVTLVDGKKYVVAEGLVEVVDQVRAWRGSIIAAGAVPAAGVDPHAYAPRAHLTAVSDRAGREGEA
ncbi:flagellar FlbD family protein [Nocardioides okcheonensis]|uniref:flagellar FlbD family protein n=1 Tax=Nocardioides okcheonensis TaxID=2894081 RepID=UPI001E470BD6|nr:flagellar FlbD family protein [Nocardioides okcheonensis]UFN43198.1 flagellar FlbD family protein [Nocardioides okcheonensis]